MKSFESFYPRLSGCSSVRNALWSGTTKNPDIRTGPLAYPFAYTLAPLTHSLALHCLLHFARSLTFKLMGKWMIRCLKTTCFCPKVQWSLCRRPVNFNGKFHLCKSLVLNKRSARAEFSHSNMVQNRNKNIKKSFTLPQVME